MTPLEILNHPAIQHLLNHEDVTQAQAARLFGVNPAKLSQWLRRVREEGHAHKLPPHLAVGHAHVSSGLRADGPLAEAVKTVCRMAVLLSSQEILALQQAIAMAQAKAAEQAAALSARKKNIQRQPPLS
ncbi:MAG: helix-turn-helix domain containing protein [Pseudomonadales bacterium]|jgi:transposase-like protein|nr:helix-turn-helix domain containing protein [Pseudomonadales bacterium]